MKKGLKKTLIGILLLLGIVFILSICMKPKAIRVNNLSYFQITPIYNTTFDDLPNLPPSENNTWGLNATQFGEIYHNDDYIYYMIIYKKNTIVNNDITNAVLYINDDYLPGEIIEFDSGTYNNYNNKFRTMQDIVINKLKDDGFITNLNVNLYTNMNYGECIYYRQYSNNTYNVLYEKGIEENIDYVNYFGIENTAYYQKKYINDLIEYMNLSQDEVRENVKEYYQKEVIPNLKEYYQDLDNDAYQQGYDDGVASNMTTGEPQLYNMLKNVALYPILIFTQGLNVDIFGINIGGLILGIFMIAVILIIIKLVMKIIKG